MYIDIKGVIHRREPRIPLLCELFQSVNIPFHTYIHTTHTTSYTILLQFADIANVRLSDGGSTSAASTTHRKLTQNSRISIPYSSNPIRPSRNNAVKNKHIFHQLIMSGNIPFELVVNIYLVRPLESIGPPIAALHWPKIREPTLNSVMIDLAIMSDLGIIKEITFPKQGELGAKRLA